MEFQTILLTREELVAVIYLNQPESRNALNMELREELRAALEEVARDEVIKAVVITGQGTAFCAGGDLRTMGDSKPFQGRRHLQNFHRLVLALRNLEKPVIAAVNGSAFGAGWSLALACDFVVASEKARFSLAFVKVGERRVAFVQPAGCNVPATVISRSP